MQLCGVPLRQKCRRALVSTITGLMKRHLSTVDRLDGLSVAQNYAVVVRFYEAALCSGLLEENFELG